MSKDIHLEINFEQYISRKLSELSNSGWQISKNDEGFNPDTALYLDDFIQYVTMVCPEKIEKMYEIAEEIKQVVMNNWERMAKEYGLSRGEIENMRPAFII